jgi:flavin reductase (DIM6/NTAB) family NADH-FMN oxidoreductase RutF
MMSTPSTASLREKFVQGMSSAACTVNIVTTDGSAGRYGLTVSAMASVSADTPSPTLLVCINEKSSAARPILDNGRFCVNVLRDDQHPTSDSFAGRSLTSGSDKFAGIETIIDTLGCPIIAGCLAAFSCTVRSWQAVGSHLVLIGDVCDVTSAGAGSPLIYTNRAYGRAMPLLTAFGER